MAKGTGQRPNRREEILAAALDCFVEKGYGAAGIADIRERSGASIGSIYHFFDGKDAIAVALFSQALSSWATASLDLEHELTAEQAIKRSVEQTIDWAIANQKLFRFMEETQFLAPVLAAREDMSAIIFVSQQRGTDLLQPYAEQGRIRTLPWDIAHALILGPTYDWLRLHSHGHAPSNVDEVKAVLAEAAWQAMRLQGP